MLKTVTGASETMVSQVLPHTSPPATHEDPVDHAVEQVVPETLDPLLVHQKQTSTIRWPLNTFAAALAFALYAR